MTVAVVILNYNGKTHLAQFLPSLLKYSSEADIYIADNGSTDGSLEWLKSNYPSLNCINLQKNYGFAGGYNEALKQVDAEYYILLNSDVEVTPEWIPPIIDLMNSNEQIAACQPKIKAYHQKDFFEYAGACGGWMDYLGYPFCRGRVFDINEEDQGQYDTAQDIFWASGAALFVRSHLFHQIGGFDASYFAHSEEIDLCWRLQKAGYQIKCQPESVVYHVGGGTLNYQSAFKTFLNFRNSLYTLLKNESALKLVWLLPIRLILDGVAGLLFISQGKYDHLKAILKAHWSFYGNFSKTLKIRRKYQILVRHLKRAGKNKLNGRYFNSIVFQYYLLGKKYFKDLL